MPRKLRQIGVSLLSVLLSLFLAEVLFRVVGFDFAREEQALNRIPPYYRQPTEPTGEVFFRRPGSQRWSGQVLNTRLKQLSIFPNPYHDEPVVTVEYDRRGFRNPTGLDDWDIVVTGDSFTELAALSQEQMFTSILARETGESVLNLGTCFTGPLTQLSYLRDFGVSPATKHAVVVFFEGNDLKDLAIEYGDWKRWIDTGERPMREFKKQTSLMRAAGGSIHEGLRALSRRLRYSLQHHRGARYVDAYFESSGGEVPVTLDYTPPNRSELSRETLAHLDHFFGEYAEFARERKVRPWLAYMPCKLRVLRDLVQVTDEASEEQKAWRPSDLPGVVSDLCDRYGIAFVDLTGALARYAREEKELPYNSIYDTHINAQGSRVVATELLRHLRPVSAMPREDQVVE
ncbi:MAG: hypothetical protein HQ559_17325 [Lentisphaerae bacterium]|nr:hypothetical protein [Lentisphaerota bacterium]